MEHSIRRILSISAACGQAWHYLQEVTKQGEKIVEEVEVIKIVLCLLSVTLDFVSSLGCDNVIVRYDGQEILLKWPGKIWKRQGI